ncbi:hypothetical protein BCL52_1348 [Salisediminibacterium halotolerans]|nr:hypothetical protein BCL39_1351 [Actinophytocola xinjiangensis]RPE87840.1 hypothetical protein EDD67_1580 [Salisediminibacterium halotolerans]TWG34904.1 hypothetical protein BCL52_1348 [Salisediminibacterium halotolerans]
MAAVFLISVSKLKLTFDKEMKIEAHLLVPIIYVM